MINWGKVLDSEILVNSLYRATCMISVNEHGGRYTFSYDGVKLRLLTHHSDGQDHLIAIDAIRGRKHVHQVPIPSDIARSLRDNEFPGKLIVDLAYESSNMSLLSLVEPVFRKSRDTLIYYGSVYHYEINDEEGDPNYLFFKHDEIEGERVRAGSNIEKALCHFVENETYYKYSEGSYGNAEIAQMWRSIP